MPTNEDLSIKLCDDCGQVDLSSYLWTPYCGHLICRLCIDKTLKNDFNYNVMHALDSKCFCSKCRADGNEEKIKKFF